MSLLDAQAILAEAQTRTGLSDWGDASFGERFGKAIDHINTIPMDDAGRTAARDNCLWLLTDRLNFFEDRKRWPLDAELIERPMFATGEPRSGTTLMHALMSVDPDARALRFWEVMHPSPPPERFPAPTLVSNWPMRNGARSIPRCGSGCTATPITTCSATAFPRTSAPGLSTSA